MNHPRSAHDVANALGKVIEQLSEQLLGPRNRALSTSHDWRFRQKGSLSVVVKGDRAGKFFDHESGAGGDALELVKVTRACGTVDAIAWALEWLGDPDGRTITPATPAAKRPTVVDDKRGIINLAVSIWSECKPIGGTLAETYLQHRGITDLSDIEDLRFHPSCKVKTIAGSMITLPAMVGLLRSIATDEPVGIHRTFLRADGRGKVDPAEHRIKAAKMMLGPSGGAVIKLCADDSVEAGLGICEGIENALTHISRGWRPIWAAPDVNHIKAFPALDGIEHLTIFADNKKPDDIKAAHECAANYTAAGRRITLHVPPDGMDWNAMVAA